MQPIIKQNIEAISNICVQHKVKMLYAFGSVVRDDFSAESDVDLLAEFSLERNVEDWETVERFYDNMEQLKEQLSALFKRDVDLLIESGIKNRYRRYFINEEKQLIYGEA